MEPVVVFSGTIMQAELLKSMLEDAEIEAFLKDEFTGTLFPWFTAPGGTGSVKVVVSEEDLAKATPLVEEFKKNIE
jgi:hypothetical protein